MPPGILQLVNFLFLRESVVFLLCAVAAYFDAKTGEIPDKINYFAILLGILFNLADFSLSAFFVAAAVFVLGGILYFSGKLGGGDVKLFVAIALLLPLVNGRVFVVDLLFISSAVALACVSIYYPVKYFLKGIRFEDIKGSLPAALLMFAFSVLCFLAPIFIPFMANLRIFSIIFFFASVFIALEKGIRKEFFLAKIPLEKLEMDEVVAMDFIDVKAKKAIVGKSVVAKGVLGETEIGNLKAAGIKEILVYRNLPKFAPFVFIAIIFLYLFPDFMVNLVSFIR